MKISIDVTPSFPEVILCKFHLSRIFRLNVALLRMNLLYFVIIFRNFRYFPFSHCIAASTDHKKCYYSWGDFVTNYHQIRRATIEGGEANFACITHHITARSNNSEMFFVLDGTNSNRLIYIYIDSGILHWGTLGREGGVLYYICQDLRIFMVSKIGILGRLVTL